MKPAQEPTLVFYCHPQALVETTEIGANTRIWAFAHVMAGTRIGADCNVGDHAFIESGVILGNNVTVKNGVSLWTGITVGDDVFIGPNCVFTNDPNPRAYIKKPTAALLTTRICRGVTIGANATILCGFEIGQYAFIGAGATILRAVLDYGLVVGNPGRQIGWMCRCAKRLPLSSDAPIDTTCICPHCQTSLVRTPGGLANL